MKLNSIKEISLTDWVWVSGGKQGAHAGNHEDVVNPDFLTLVSENKRNIVVFISGCVIGFTLFTIATICCPYFIKKYENKKRD
ncbi:MAG: hypothetical protein KKE11_03515 [Gammaproteobacteria bacterium]|nr:hypothetical protein [Gammaproteobacteria bacterium]